jgi:hypothetical protein
MDQHRKTYFAFGKQPRKQAAFLKPMNACSTFRWSEIGKEHANNLT